MKSKNPIIKMTTVLVALFFIVCSYVGNAQVHTIVNNKTCSLIVNVEFANPGCNCVTGKNYTINPTSSLVIPILCAPYSDIQVTLLSIGGQTPVGTTPCLCEYVGDPNPCINSGGTVVSGTVTPTTCGSAWNMTWVSSLQTIIN